MDKNITLEAQRARIEEAARLLAAAPELVSALERMVDVTESMGGHAPAAYFTSGAMNVAKAALSKAKGE